MLFGLKFDHARWGGSGALYLQSAVAGFNSLHEAFLAGACLRASGVEDWSLRQWEHMNPVRFGRKQR